VARISERRVAQVAISVLFLALVRALSEYYRLEYTRGSGLTLAEVAPFITGALMAALGAWAAVIAFFVEKHRLATWIVGATIGGMLVYKVVVIGGLP